MISAIIIRRFRRKLTRLRLQPIRVFCLHQVSFEYDPIRCFECDWLNIDVFKQSMTSMLKHYTFISLPEARTKLAHDLFRIKRYATLTFDDGYRSNLPILRWLDSINVPYTLFLNGKYLDGKSCSPHILKHARQTETDISEKSLVAGLYFSPDDIKSLLATTGSHGYEHIDATLIDKDCFKESVKNNYSSFELNGIPSIPFHAYTWGKHNSDTDEILRELGITPVLIDNEKNYNDPNAIHRELFPIY